jgi:choline dehydrogenase-like flavoprotein
MIIDANELTATPEETYDLCIIGSGPAGLTVANELRRHRLRVCVLESGRSTKTEHTNRLKTVRSEGAIPIKANSRERILGGTSSTWDGLSAPLEPIDVEPRPWVSLSGWPIGYGELQRRYADAAERYAFPSPELYAHDHVDGLKAVGDYHFAWRALTERLMLAPRRPPRFATLLRHLLDAPEIAVYTDATVTELCANAARSAIAACVVRTRDMKRLRIEAKAFVVAAGAIENARLLLNSTDLCSAGLGNERDQVGRHFMNHPKNPCGLIALNVDARHLPAYFGCLTRGHAAYLALRLDDATQRRLGVLNSYVRFEPLYAWSDTGAVQHLMTYVKSKPRLWEQLQAYKGSASLRDYSETGDDVDDGLAHDAPSLPGLVLAMLRAPAPVAQYLFFRIFDNRIRPRLQAIRLRNFMEMEPLLSNRIVLASEKDCYGTPLPLVRHTPTSLDRRSVIALQQVLGDELRASGFGTLTSELADADPWPINADASHHLGGTRMGVDRRTSVVNSDGRLHGIPNVYVAGGSTFVTSGYANPTYTIVALAIRLADHLARRLAPRTEPLGSRSPLAAMPVIP